MLQLKEVLKQKLHLIVSDRELYLLMSRYDKDQDGVLRFSDFCEILAPKNPPKYIRSIIKKKFEKVPNKKEKNFDR